MVLFELHSLSSIIGRVIVNDECGRKQPLPILSYYPKICLEGLSNSKIALPCTEQA